MNFLPNIDKNSVNNKNPTHSSSPDYERDNILKNNRCKSYICKFLVV